MPWILTKTFRFEASHQLPSHAGKCQRLHGHSWVLCVEVGGDRLVSDGSSRGMVMDYGEISACVAPLLRDTLDHWHLNTSTGLVDPTSEALAHWIYTQLHAVLPSLLAVTVEETCTSACRYTAT